MSHGALDDLFLGQSLSSYCVCKQFPRKTTRMLLLVIWGLAALAALVFYFKNVYSKFEKKGVKTPPVVFPFGNWYDIFFGGKHVSQLQKEIYNMFPKERFIGNFELTKPVLLIRDMDLIKKITVKDYEYFIDHQTFLDPKVNPLFANGVFFMKGQEWKDMRSTLTPAFTASKMRLMIPFMNEVGDQMILNLKKNIDASKSGQTEVDVKDLMARYACDVIASCAFGLKVDSHSERENEFYTQGVNAASFKFRQQLVFLLSANLPWLVTLFNIKMFEEKSENFFRSIVLKTMEERERLKIHRPDMIHLLSEARKGKLQKEEKTPDAGDGYGTVGEVSGAGKSVTREWSDDALVAQAVLFFVAGFESVSTTMSFLLYELALHPEVQDKLVEEIREVSAKHGGKVDFNVIQDLTYLDMCVQETMRKWPAVMAMERLCVKDYNLGKPNPQAKEDYIIRKGDALQIPTMAIQYDPQYYPDPEKFDPERFSEANKHNINPNSYGPFGLGPRNCIGLRFALYEIKIMAYQLLQHMEVSPSPRTTIPPVIDPSTFNLWLKGGTHLNFKIRA
ncbi:cytochrome p450 domain-containing protein [Phthorimaea operculella]|nr:cytochrome p450 domain-containing protein [Phthorimaea operculella]